MLTRQIYCEIRDLKGQKRVISGQIFCRSPVGPAGRPGQRCGVSFSFRPQTIRRIGQRSLDRLKAHSQQGYTDDQQTGSCK
jgi:hypothetical protein